MYTKLDPEQVIRRAVDFFGEGGFGLTVTEQALCCATFEGGGGHVVISVNAGEKTEVELVTREWDYDVRRFMRDIG